MMTEILTGPRPRYDDYATHKWVTAPVSQTSPLLTCRRTRAIAGSLGPTSPPVLPS